MPEADTADLAGLLGAATEREPLSGAPGKSGARLERLVIGGERFVLKHMNLATDWTMRTAGSLRGATIELWQRGTFDRLPGCFNQPIVAASRPRTAAICCSCGTSASGSSPRPTIRSRCPST
ncbi:MAG: hypothetical protein ACR2FU_23750 [Streptosporangiaceae bacterium]